jgi:hypothetical protein
MPWIIQKNGDRFCVHKKNADGTAGERLKCHETEGEAQDHMRALYASVTEAKLFEYMLMVHEAKGGEGSGNFGHAGRPGEIGGSAPGEGATGDRPISDPVLKHVDAYTKNAYYSVNQILREDKSPEDLEDLTEVELAEHEKVQKRIKAIDQAIEKFGETAPPPEFVYRGDDGGAIHNVFAAFRIRLPMTHAQLVDKVDKYNAEISKAVGTVFRDKAFLSTTEDPEIAKSFAWTSSLDLSIKPSSAIPTHWKIETNDEKLLPLEKVVKNSNTKSEKERLFRRGRRIKITGMKFVPREDVAHLEVSAKFI